MDTKTKSKFSTYSIVMMALFAAILCVSAYISIPLPNGTHITLLNFVITLIALVFPLAESFFIGLIWMYSDWSVFRYSLVDRQVRDIYLAHMAVFPSPLSSSPF